MSDEKGVARQRLSVYGGYVVFLLFAIALLNSVDRSIITILQVPIQKELGLSDAQLGALTGLAFALFYTTLGVPIAYLADRTSHKSVLAGAVAFWSLMTACCGLTVNYLSLFMFRVGVGGGEAAGNPTSHALIARYIPTGRRGVALGLWGLSIPLGKMVGLASAGGLNQVFGWRDTFMLVGAAGVILGPLAFFTLRDDKSAAEAQAVSERGQPTFSFAANIRRLWAMKSFRYMAIAGGLNAFAMYAVLNWNAPFYVRVYALPIRAVAGDLALMTGVGGGFGIFFAGAIADWMGRDKRWYAWVPGICAFLVLPCGLVQYLTHDPLVSMIFGTLNLAFVQAHLAPVVAAVQSMVKPNMRAFSSSVLTFISGTFGLAFGPLLAGAISDHLIHSRGMHATSLAYALSVMLLFSLGASVFYWLASRHVREDFRSGVRGGAKVGH